MYVRLYAAHADGRRVVTSAANGATQPSTASSAGSWSSSSAVRWASAGQLIGTAGLGSGQAVDAILVATALAEAGRVVIATSDVGDLKAFVGDERRVAVVPANQV
jgi:hypothetical protein